MFSKLQLGKARIWRTKWFREFQRLLPMFIVLTDWTECIILPD